MKGKVLYILLVLVVLFSGCKTTKFVPEGALLLDKARVKVQPQKEQGLTKGEANALAGDLKSYLRQKQNTEVFGFWKLQLHVYNTAPADTTSKANKFFARNAHKVGEAPVIYDEELTAVSMQQLAQAMQNKGYFRVEVDTVQKVKDRKMDLTYTVVANTPYTVRKYTVDIDRPEVREIAMQKQRKVDKGMQFDAGVMDEERQRITSRMHNKGYFYFDKSMLVYTADSSYRDNTVEVELALADYVQALPDSVEERLYTPFTIRRVFFHCEGGAFIRESVLRRNCRLKEGERYAEWRVERTYTLLNNLGAVKYVDISFDPIGRDKLDCHITVSKSKVHSVSAELEGTDSAGDWGIGAGVGYQNRNIFRGSELLSLNARASYEWR